MTRCTLPVFFSKIKKSFLPMKAMLVGCDRPLTTVFTDRFGSSIAGPLAGEPMVVSRLAELSLGSGSFSLAVTFAVFDNWPGACGCTTMFMIANEPFGKLPRLH